MTNIRTCLRLAWPLVLALLIGAGVRFAWYAYTYGPDGERFVYQAHALMRGEGFLFDGRPTTLLPPGYPLLLCAVFTFHDDPFALIPVQFLLSLGSIALVYSAIAPWSKRGAALAAFAMALHPYLALKVSEVRSETWGVFLTSLLVYSISRAEQRDLAQARLGQLFSIGFLCLAVLLTVPALAFLCLALWLVVAARIRASGARLATLTLGSLALALPWQLHCYRAVGHLEPLMFGRNTGVSIPGPNAGVLNPESGFGRWTRSWMTSDTQMGVWWWSHSFASVPEDVFESEQQKRELHRLHTLACEDKVDPNLLDRAYGEAADRRYETLPLRTRVEFPLRRALLLWMEMPQLHHAQMDRIAALTPQAFQTDKAQLGTRRAWLRLAKAAWSLAVYALYLAYPAGFVVLLAKTWNDRRLVPLAVLLGVLAYTAASAYLAVCEVRRNLPLFPALLFLLAYYPTRNHFRIFPLVWRRPHALVGEHSACHETTPAEH